MKPILAFTIGVLLWVLVPATMVLLDPDHVFSVAMLQASDPPPDCDPPCDDEYPPPPDHCVNCAPPSPPDCALTPPYCADAPKKRPVVLDNSRQTWWAIVLANFRLMIDLFQ
jgi:hypothetical protein